MSISLDTKAFYAGDIGSKLGFGSSAAMTVALTQALYRSYCEIDEEYLTKIFRLALSSHRKAQGNLGSGVDIAACTFGGVTRYEMGINNKAEQIKPESLKIWRDLNFACIWTGTSESTRKMVRGVGQLKMAYPQIYREKIKRMSDLAYQGCEAYKEQSTSRFLEIVDIYQSCLKDLGQKSGMPIVSPVHMNLVDKVRKLKGVYKPSGAGSGDIGIAFAENTNDMERISEMIVQEGYTIIPVRIAQNGVQSYNN
jgi:phosphomevalonate kinase